jgi:diguanylate cyclase (GGDEF)-like protein
MTGAPSDPRASLDPAARFVAHVLQSTVDARQACQTVADFLAAHEGMLPSVYLEQEGRLRCQAQRGYAQILDGIPFDAGIIGRTFRTGRATINRNASLDPDYLAAAPVVRAEVCIPVLIDGRPVGVLNVESPGPMGDDVVDDVTYCAALLGARLAVVGVGAAPRAAERLIRHATMLSGMVDRPQIEDALVAAAVDTLAMDSAALLVAEDDGFALAVAIGPHVGAFESLERADRSAIARWVLNGTSSYTVGASSGATFPGNEPLRRMGAETIAAVLVGSAGAPRGVLVVADARVRVPSSEEIELLELLAAHGESCLHVASALDELRLRAASDPLTGLGHHATFHAALATARQDRRSGIALCMADVDGFKRVNDSLGHQAGDRLLQSVAAAMAGAVRAGDSVYRVGGDEFAALLAVDDEAGAAILVERLTSAVAEHGITISIGVALARPDEGDAELIARADRSLYVVKARNRELAA